MEHLDGEKAKHELHKSAAFSSHNATGTATYRTVGSLKAADDIANTFQNSLYIANAKNQVSNVLPKQQSSSNDIGLKKVAPIVPPKPLKQIKSPEVPQSMLVHQGVCEPLHSKRLQNNDAEFHYNKQNEPSIIPKQPIQIRKDHSLYGNQNSLYSKLNKISLDNPAVLEQQLEALAHHKMQMEKKGLLQKKEQKLNSYGASSTTAKIPSDSYYQAQKTFNESIYSSVCVPPQTNTFPNPCTVSDKKSNINAYGDIARNYNSNPVYANDPAVDTAGKVPYVYGNIHYKNNVDRDFAPETTVINDVVNKKALKPLETQIDDDIPSPPSPVSSSYSELRRATDIFSKIPATSMDSSKPSMEAHASNLSYPQYGENSNSTGKLVGSSSGQQNYMNMIFNNEYGNYNENACLQSISQDSSDYYGYGNYSQGSSTYESIYEPINPKYQHMQNINDSQTVVSNAGSSDNISSIFASHLNKNPNQQPSREDSCDTLHLTGQNHNHKNTLTDLFVQSMHLEDDPDSYGICAKCNNRVVGENSGCTAMDQIYHISCFTCSQCQINLQGKPFYSLEGNPYCEYDYLQTLEKCSACMKPILERILRATGKPYHPQCFRCVVCGNSLDGIPFTVDANNQNYCIADFHKKFAPRCCVCKLPIMPEQGQEETVRVVALDRSYHFECYKCEDCGLLLSSEADGRGCYPLDDHVLCKSCNANRVQMLTNLM